MSGWLNPAECTPYKSTDTVTFRLFEYIFAGLHNFPNVGLSITTVEQAVLTISSAELRQKEIIIRFNF